MFLKNNCFQIQPDLAFFYCDDGLYEGAVYIDTSTKEGVKMVHHDVVGTITPGRRISPVPDFLYASPHHCFSERAFDLFRQEQLNLWPEFLWVPVQIKQESGKMIGRYWWAKFNRRRDFNDPDVFDYEHSKYTVYPPTAFKNLPPPGVIFPDKVSKWVLRGEAIGSLDFFHAHNVRWYGSARLKRLVETHRLRGFVFNPVDVWVP